MKSRFVFVVNILFFVPIFCCSVLFAQNKPELVLPVGHSAPINYAEYCPKGKTIVTASSDHTAKIWDAETGRLLHSFEGHTGWINSARFSPDGKNVVTASDDHTAKIWNSENGKLLHSLKGHSSYVYSARYSSNGITIVTFSFDLTTKIWDANSGILLESLEGHFDVINSVTYSPDRMSYIKISDDNTAQIWDTDTKNLLHSLEGHTDLINYVSYSPDGKNIVTASDDKTAKIWDAGNGKQVHSLEGYNLAVNSSRFSPDGKNILTASWDSTAKMWDAKTGELLHSLEGHTSVVNNACYSPNGKNIVTASWDNTAKIWDAEGGKLVHSLEGHTDWIISASFSPDGKNIVTASWDNTAKIWDAENGKLLYSLKKHNDDVNSAKFSPDGENIVTASDDNTAKIWNVENGKLLHSLRKHNNGVNSAVFSPNGKNIITASDDKTAKIWDAKTGELLHSLEGHTDIVISATYSPNGQIILTGSYDNTAKIWDAESGNLLHSLNGHNSVVYSSKFSPDGITIVTASFDHTIKIWDAENGKLLHSLKGHVNRINTARYSPDGKIISSASQDGSFIIWDAQNGKMIVKQFVFNRNEMLTLSENGLFDATPGAMKTMYFVQGNEVIPLEAYYEQFYRPRLWEMVMNGEKIEKATIDFENQKPSPGIEITEPDQSLRGVGTLSAPDNLLKVSVQLTDRGGGIDELRIYHNGKLNSSEVMDIDSKDNTITKTFYIKLLSGVNDIKITAFNKERTEKSENFKVAYTGKIQQLSNLYVLAIGINEYKKSSYKLNYAVHDAEAFVAGIDKGAKDIFGDVKLIRLLDQQAGKKAITAAFDSIKAQAMPNDVFIFYYAGHGSMSIAEKNNKPIFYLLPYEVTEMYNPETLENSAISANAIMNFSRDIKAQKQLFILDACQSGGAVDMLANRSAVEERAIALLAKSTGTYFLAASGSEQFASEVSSLGHGVFTYALLNGLAGGADAANDNNVTVEELLPFVKRTVPELSKRYKGSEQFPVSYGFGQDFPVVVSGVVKITDEPTKPAGKYDAFSIEELEKLKKEAISQEDYEKAAEIRDEIKKRGK